MIEDKFDIQFSGDLALLEYESLDGNKDIVGYILEEERKQAMRQCLKTGRINDVEVKWFRTVDYGDFYLRR